jgi:adenylosuccinate synthase
MSVTAVVGAQWGDEGKGRIIDYLAQASDLVIRFQGGDNAGHTIVNEKTQKAHNQKVILHLIPSGIFNPETTCVIGTGCVVNPDTLLKEIDALEAIGVSTAKLYLSERAHIILPYHQALDSLKEQAKTQLGTTKKGIGPAYADKMARRGLRLGDLNHPDWLAERLRQALDIANRELAHFGAALFDFDDLMERCRGWRDRLQTKIVNVLPMVQEACLADKAILLEGQLGVLRDIDWGIYPYATSSNPTPGYALVSAGLPVTTLKEVVGVVKAYSTAVGSGPFVTELHEKGEEHHIGQFLRDVGQEYGATTGRPRRCGWLDGVALAYSSWLNGFTDLAVTKLDVLDGLEEIKICTAYRRPNGQIIEAYPDTLDLEPDLEDPDRKSGLEPVYETWPGWENSKNAHSWAALPQEARRYLKRIEELAQVGKLIKPRLRYVSVGPARDQMFEVSSSVI